MALREEVDWPECTPASLLENAPVLNSSETSLAKLLLKCGQSHLFAEWEPVGIADEKKHEFFAQIQSMHEAYPGGIGAYVQNARRLLAGSAAGANPLEGWVPSVPPAQLGVQLTPGDAEFERYENLGLDAAMHLAFAVPAGGLGERLGYSGVKFSVPAEISSGASVLQVYASHVVALQQLLTARLGRDVRLPFVVMTSDDTHGPIGALLQQHSHYGLAASQVTLLKQQKVAALADPQARFAAAGPYRVQAKPHGHGDLHALLHASGIAAKWQREGRRWLFFFQDSSTLYFSTYLASLGVAVERSLDLQYVTMPRRAGMALGVVASLAPTPPAATSAAGAGEMLRRLVVGGSTAANAGTSGGLPLIPIEYNQLEPALAAAGGSDVNGPGGYSAFPGNTNGLIVGLATYVAALERSGGAVREFVNPKYADEARSAFSSPTRLECMMQDYAWLLPHGSRVGFVGYPMAFGYFPCKNGLAAAARLTAQGVPPYAASTAEMAVYAAHAAALRLLGARVARARERTFHGVTVALGPAVVLAPSFCPCLSVLRPKLPTPAQICISERSTLLVDGTHIVIEQLELDGALEVCPPPLLPCSSPAPLLSSSPLLSSPRSAPALPPFPTPTPTPSLHRCACVLAPRSRSAACTCRTTAGNSTSSPNQCSSPPRAPRCCASEGTRCARTAAAPSWSRSRAHGWWRTACCTWTVALRAAAGSAAPPSMCCRSSAWAAPSLARCHRRPTARGARPRSASRPAARCACRSYSAHRRASPSRWSRTAEGYTSHYCPRSDLPCCCPPTCRPRPRRRQTMARVAAAKVAMLAAAGAQAPRCVTCMWMARACSAWRCTTPRSSLRLVSAPPTQPRTQPQPYSQPQPYKPKNLEPPRHLAGALTRSTSARACATSSRMPSRRASGSRRRWRSRSRSVPLARRSRCWRSRTQRSP